MLIAVTSAVFATPVSADIFAFTGFAQSNHGSELYEERHQVEGSCESGMFRPLKHLVEYRHSGAEKIFATKRLDYSQSAVRPTMNYQQPDFQESLEVTYPDSGSVAIKWQQPDGDTKRSSVEISENMVVDAGFNSLVRRDWDKIVNGEQIEFRFLAPTRGTDYALVFEPTDNPNIKADYVVQIRPDSFVLDFLMDPITLGYNEKGALTAYSGLTNVRENANKNYTATILYTVDTYPKCELIP
ncbi:MAG: hypothetical protein ACTHWH_06280 [Marinobacter sp.]